MYKRDTQLDNFDGQSDKFDASVLLRGLHRPLPTPLLEQGSRVKIDFVIRILMTNTGQQFDMGSVAAK